MVENGSNGKAGNSKKKDQTAQKIIDALKESSGLLTQVAKKAGVSYTTVWRYTQEYPSVAEAVREAKEALLDFTEGKLYEQIKSGNLTAIIFYLKTQGKGRGYIERHEYTGEEGQPIKVIYERANDREPDNKTG